MNLLELMNLDAAKVKLFAAAFMALCIIATAAILIDLWDGVHTARQTGQAVHSHKLRCTIAKTMEYWRIITMGFLLDCVGIFFDVYEFPFMAAIFTAGLLYIEWRSLREHSKRRKSHTAELTEIIRDIIAAATKRDAREILEKLEKGETREE